MQHELLAFQGFAQAVFHRQPLKGPGIHRGGVKLVVVAALFLGAVESGVGVFQQGVDVGAIVRIQADADAGGDMQLVLVKQKHGLEHFQDPLGDFDGFVGALQARQKNDKFIASQAGEGIAFIQAAGQAFRHALQEPVADGRPQGIDDVFEAVQVHKEDREHVAVPVGMRQRQRQAVLE